MKKSNIKAIIFYIALIAVIVVMSSALLGSMKSEPMSYSDIVMAFKRGDVKQFTVSDDNVLTMMSQDDKLIGAKKLLDLGIFYNDLNDIIQQQVADGVITYYDYEAPATYPWWVSLLPYVLMMAVFIGLWLYFMRQMTGKDGRIGSFGKARTKLGADEKSKVYFKDVAGADEEKEELSEVVDFLRNPDKYTKLGAKIPRGVLLVGPPGTGKTLLAKAVAGEAGVPFYSISGSDFVEMYVGVGASRVRDLFETARKNPASIIFIDEIDAVGRHRGAGLGGGHDEREQTLNQLLVEMDGFGGSEGVIVIAATNRPDILDPALLRPGRFDRQITVNYPDVRGREEILKVHARGKSFEADVDLGIIARTTVGFTGADLANLLNEAALLASRRNKQLIGMNDLEEAMIKVVVGPAKKSKVISDKEKRLTAYHEAGHAVATYVRQPDTPVHRISVIPAGRTGGFTMSLPTEDQSYSTKDTMQGELVTLLGGRVAEKLKLGDISTGASNDLKRATGIAKKMVTRYGMSDELGPVVYGSEHSSDEVFLGRDFTSSRDYSEATASRIDTEVRRIIDSAYDECTKILIEYNDKLDFIAEFLFRYETMDDGQFAAAMSGNPTMEELYDMMDDKRRRSEAENAEAKKRREAEDKRREEERAAAEKAEAERLKKLEEYGINIRRLTDEEAERMGMARPTEPADGTETASSDKDGADNPSESDNKDGGGDRS